MPILFITSFNKKLYEVSGKNLVNSFIETKTEGDLFIGGEDLEANDTNTPDQKTSSNLIYHDLSQNSFLNNWLQHNADIIPQYLGGRAVSCNCEKPDSRLDRDHIKGCYYSWWNRNTSRWFRKVACLHFILTEPNLITLYDKLVWIDADCIFKNQVTEKLIEGTCFNGNDIFYMLGQKRLVIETGIFGIKLNPAGKFFLKQFFQKYTSGDFRGYCRWDDGYIFNKIRKAYAHKVKGFDIGRFSQITDVADQCDLTPYITHFKGRHGRVMNIMK